MYLFALALVLFTPSAQAQSFELELKRVASIRSAFGDTMVQELTNLPPTHYKRARERVLALSKRVLDGDIQAAEAAKFLRANFRYITNHVGDLLGEGAAQCLLKEPVALLRSDLFEPIVASQATQNPDNAPAVCRKITFQCEVAGVKVDAFSQHIVKVCGGKPSSDIEIPAIAIVEPPRRESAPAPAPAEPAVAENAPATESAPAATGSDEYTFGTDSLSDASGPIMETPPADAKSDSLAVDNAVDQDLMVDSPTAEPAHEEAAPVAAKPGKRRIGEPELEAE